MIDISVIIPVYNKKDFLQKSINSVLKSTFKNLEIICIDDASTDGSKELLEELEKHEHRITVLKNVENYGVSYSRNRGISYAKGKYIVFLDADDYFDEQALQIYYEALESHNAQGCFIKLQMDSGSKETGILQEYPGVYGGLQLLDEFVRNNEFFLYACGAIWKKSFLIENDIKFENIKIGEGGLFILEALLKAERVIYSGFPGYHYVINETSTNKNSDAMQEATIGQIKQLIFMIKNIQNGKNNREIVNFLDWYIKKNIGGIKNLRIDRNERVQNIFSDEDDKFLFALIRGSYLERQIQIDEDMKMKIVQKGRVYLYGAGYETLDAIKYCHQIGVEIVRIFVTSKFNNPDNMFGFHIFEFDKALIEDVSVPFIITAHEKHQKAIIDMLTECGIKNIVGL